MLTKGLTADLGISTIRSAGLAIQLMSKEALIRVCKTISIEKDLWHYADRCLSPKGRTTYEGFFVSSLGKPYRENKKG